MFNPMRLLSIFLLMTISSLALAELGNLNPAQLEAMRDEGATIIDIRTPPEWKQTGVIETSHKMMFFNEQGKPHDVNAWLKQLNQIAPDQNQAIILVCRSGNRSGAVGRFLSDKVGRKQVFHLQNGINSWIREKRPTLK